MLNFCSRFEYQRERDRIGLVVSLYSFSGTHIIFFYGYLCTPDLQLMTYNDTPSTASTYIRSSSCPTCTNTRTTNNISHYLPLPLTPSATLASVSAFACSP